MPKAKPTNDAEEKPLPPIRLREQLQGATRKACARLAANPTEFVNTAVREKLERMGLWDESEKPEDK